MTFDQILSDLKKKIYYPVYLLFGEEPYYIDEITAYIENHVLTDTEKEFNQSIIYGRDTDVPSIIDYAKRYPMMSNFQVVIVREAQDVEKIELLQPYIENPLKSTLLVLACKYMKVDRRKSFAKAIDKNGVLYESSRIYENKIPDWITNRLSGMGYTITTKATILLAEYLGNDLNKIKNELGKLIINLEKGAGITEDTVEKNIGISKDFNIFELHNALGKKNVYKANMIVNHFAANPKQYPLAVTLTMLYGFFLKLMIYHQLPDKSSNSVASALSIHPYFIKDYSVAANNYTSRKIHRVISYLRDYDLRLKGVNNYSTTEGELLKELVYKIIH